MINCGIVFFLLAIFAGILGFAGIMSVFAGVSQVLFFVFLLTSLVLLILGDPYLRRL